MSYAIALCISLVALLLLTASAPLAFAYPSVNASSASRSAANLPAPTKVLPLNFSLRRTLPEKMPWYGWQLFSWRDWLLRPSSGPLLMPMPANHPALSVFEARFAAILHQPVTRFTEGYLHNISTIEQLDPENIHKIIANPRMFTVETMVPFPKEWAELIAAGKAAKVLSAKSSGDLTMISEFGYFSHAQILQNANLRNTVRLLDITGRTPYAINIQGIVSINEIAEFGSMITFFYRLKGARTLMVSDFALGLKNKVLNLGFDVGGLNFTGESVILGENRLLNTSTGIGAGLPQYTEELFLNMYHGLDH